MKTAFITGAAGFLAHHLVELLVKKGYTVKCLVKKNKKTENIEHLPVEIVKVDLKNPSEIEGLIPQGALVFHCYSLSPGAHASKEVYNDENVISTQNLLVECKKSNISKLVYISSCSIIGPNTTDNITEDTIPSPDNFYGQSKLEAENKIKEFHQSTNIPTLILRLSSLFGPGMHPKTSSLRLFRMTTKPIFPLVGNGKNIYEFSYIKNISNGIYLASEKIEEGLILLNIADEKKNKV